MSDVQILLVEDEPAIAEPLADALAANGFDLHLATTAEDALAKQRALQPDLILLDLILPDGNGRDVCSQIRRDSQVPIIMLTACGSETDRIVGLEIGADDYIVKPFSAAEVTARIRAVLRRSRSTTKPAQGTKIGDLQIDPATRTVTVSGSEVELSRKEFELLSRLAADAGSVVTREDLMSDVWDRNWFGSTRTLDVHIGWLRSKLGDDSTNPRFIHTIRGVGFRLSAPTEEKASLAFALAFYLPLGMWWS